MGWNGEERGLRGGREEPAGMVVGISLEGWGLTWAEAMPMGKGVWEHPWDLVVPWPVGVQGEEEEGVE